MSDYQEQIALLMSIVEKVAGGGIPASRLPLDVLEELVQKIYKGLLVDQKAADFTKMHMKLLERGAAHDDSVMIVNEILLLISEIQEFTGARDLRICLNRTVMQNMKMFVERSHYRNKLRVVEWHAAHRSNRDAAFQGRGVVYSAITGGYDQISDPVNYNKEFDYIMFTDNPELKSDVWQVRLVDNPEALDSTRLARRVKILGHEYLEGYDYSVWVDGKLAIIDDLKEYIQKYRGQEPVLCFNHHTNDCIYGELESCLKLHKDDEMLMRDQVAGYRQEGYPEHLGMIESGLMVRELNNPEVIKLMQRWWHEVKNKSKRDQLSFNYACWKQDMVYDTSDLHLYDNKYVDFRGHNC